MIRYDRLWKTMEDKELTQYRLIKQHGFSAGQIGRLKKNMHVSTHTIDTLCTILQCGIGDIMEFCPDETSGWTGPLPAQTEEPTADKPKAKKAAKGKTAAEKPEKAAKKADKSGKEKLDK
ncbi:helix-turn-helix transcriptional regulator, partial [Enterocloster lavalensis]|uniref:helix-turn-helix domain-containing protein n=2 Tax=Lachnospiraceae TaxID=186803 RepID=UPI002FDA3A00